ncbi:MAG: glycosyltransferase family 2 protein [Aeoliella sp.]
MTTRTAATDYSVKRDALATSGETVHSDDPPLSSQQKVVVVLPAFNEAEALVPLLAGLQRDLGDAGIHYEVIVVDDGSADDTALVASKASFDMPVTCVEHDVNQGLAAALRTGFQSALARSSAGDVIVTLDADNTHPPGSIPRLVTLIREGHDVVIASRYQPGSRVLGVPLHRNLLSLGARGLFKIAFPIRGVRDYTCGYRAYRQELLQEASDYYEDRFVSEQGFSCMVDVLLKLRRFHPVMGEAPLILRYDLKGGVSKMRVAKTVWQTLKLMARRKLRKP